MSACILHSNNGFTASVQKTPLDSAVLTRICCEQDTHHPFEMVTESDVNMSVYAANVLPERVPTFKTEFLFLF